MDDTAKVEFVIKVLLAILILAGNSLVIYLYFVERTLSQKQANRFVISLALCDLLVALIFIPCHELFQESIQKVIPLPIAGYVASIATLGSLWNLTALTYDRCVAVFDGLRYEEIMTDKKVTKMMVGIWVSDLFITFLPLTWRFVTPEEANVLILHIYQFILVTVMVVVHIILCGVYVALFKINRHHLRFSQLQSIRFVKERLQESAELTGSEYLNPVSPGFRSCTKGSLLSCLRPSEKKANKLSHKIEDTVITSLSEKDSICCDASETENGSSTMNLYCNSPLVELKPECGNKSSSKFTPGTACDASRTENAGSIVNLYCNSPLVELEPECGNKSSLKFTPGTACDASRTENASSIVNLYCNSPLVELKPECGNKSSLKFTPGTACDASRTENASSTINMRFRLPSEEISTEPSKKSLKLRAGRAFERLSNSRAVCVEMRAAKVVLILFAFNTVCWLPTVTLNVVYLVSWLKDKPQIPMTLKSISSYCFLIYSLVNPWIYGLLKADFKRAMKKHILKKVN